MIFKIYSGTFSLLCLLMIVQFACAQTISEKPIDSANLQYLIDPPVATHDSLDEIQQKSVPSFRSLSIRSSDFAASSSTNSSTVPVAGFAIDASNRNSTISGYHYYYMASEGYDGLDGFDGDVLNCIPGTLSDDFQDMTLRRINYYRAQVGLLANISFSSEKSEKCQKAAIIMAKYDGISHNPDSDFLSGNSSDPCIDQDVMDAAQFSNLAYGTYGPGSIDGLITDDGSNNAAVGHRRWFFYTRAQEMGNGATPAHGVDPDNASQSKYPYIGVVWVIGEPYNPNPPIQAVAWPNEGYIPWQLVPNDGEDFPRWSYSYPGADFSGASVSMMQGSASISLTQEGIRPISSSSFIGDSTIVWRPSGIPNAAPSSDTTYTVTITGVKDAPFTSVTYDVIVVDPYRLNDSAVITGSANPVSGIETIYTFSPVDHAEAYEALIAEVNPSLWLEGAEDNPAPQIIDGTDARYSLISSAYAAIGSKSFHLATPDFSEEYFEIDRTIIPQPGCQINFKYRRFFMHPDTKLRIELSLDDGLSYSTIDTIGGQNSSGSSVDFDSNFIDTTIPVPESYTNALVKLRLRLEPTGSTYTETTPSNSNGLYIDDVSVSNCLEVTASTTMPLSSVETSFGVAPTAVNQQYYLQVRARLGGHWFGYGDSLIVTSKVPQDPPIITSPSTATGEQGVAFSYAITANNSLITSYNASGLPAGANVDTTTGQITGALAPGLYDGITISASNSIGTGNAPLIINILTGYQAAIANNYPELGGPEDDDDLDGVPNILELAILGMDPETPDANLMPTAIFNEDTFTVTFQKSGMHGIDYGVESTTTLQSPLPWPTDDLNLVVNENESTIEVSYPTNLSDKYFIRLTVEQSDDTTL